MAPAAQERYEPLPGFTRLPGWLLGKLSRRARRRLAVAAVVIGVVVSLLLADLIATGHRQAAEQRKRDAATLAQFKRDLAEDQRPRRARLAPGTGPGAALERAVTADVRARVKAGLLEGPVVGTSCTAIGNAPGAFHCFTLSTRRRSTRTIEVGYRFSAKADTAAGTLAWCKRNPRPLHPDTSGFIVLPVSKDCLP